MTRVRSGRGHCQPALLTSSVLFRDKAAMPVSRHLNPVQVLQQVEETLPDNALLVVDGGDFVATAAYLVQPRGPLRWLDPGKEKPTPGAACTAWTLHSNLLLSS